MAFETLDSRLRGNDKEILYIAVIHLPHISNFTDFDALAREPGVQVRYIQSVSQIGRPDLLILPGTKATMADYRFLIQDGFADAIQEYAKTGGRIFGLCGGCGRTDSTRR